MVHVPENVSTPFPCVWFWSPVAQALDSQYSNGMRMTLKSCSSAFCVPGLQAGASTLDLLLFSALRILGKCSTTEQYFQIIFLLLLGMGPRASSLSYSHSILFAYLFFYLEREFHYVAQARLTFAS